MQTLSEEIRDHLHAGFPAIWLIGKDIDAVETAAAQAAADAGRKFRTLPSTAMTVDGAEETVSLHLAPRIPVANPAAVVGLADWMRSAKTRGATLIFVAPDSSLSIPEEWRCCVAVLELDMPTAAELAALAVRIARESGAEQSESEIVAEMSAAGGMTRIQAENAVALSLATRGRIERSVIQNLKLQALKKSGSLAVHSGNERFEDVAGFEAAKKFTLQSISSGCGRGILLLGVSGAGKSALAKALGNETRRPTLTFDVGSLFGSLVGQTEERVRKALAIADAMAPCVLFIDEVEKALGGSGSGSERDGGVSSRLLGTLLTWLQDHQSDVYLIATANAIECLPPELLRAERFDAIFFVDVPSVDDRAKIWKQYRKLFFIADTDRVPADENWTGAEIRQCCRNAQMLGCSLTEAAAYVVPVAVTAREKTEALRAFASQRCIDAHRGGIYSGAKNAETASPKTARRINRRAENN